MNEFNIKCPKCFTEFNPKTKWGINKFCSRKCANSRIKTKEQKLKLSKKLKGRISSRKGILLKERIEIKCSICLNSFSKTIKQNKIYCSNKCARLSPKLGGFRKNSGRSKSGYYKTIYCGSTYELAWVIYNLDHNIPFKRFEGYILWGDNKKYYPDFFQNDTIIEIKGFKSKDVEEKCLACIEQGKKIKILYLNDIKFMIDYVKEKYRKQEIFELYDDFKPKYIYECSFCQKKFFRNKKSKKNITCCSQRCAVKKVREIYLKNKFKPDLANSVEARA